jgi:ribosome-binding protein aMBF1 (putative translation factor)
MARFLLHSGLNREMRKEAAAEIKMTTKAPTPVDKHVGNRVRMRRLMVGMTQEKLGDKLGLTFQQVQKYEKGTNRISASRLQEMSHILQVSVPFFFEGAPQIGGHVEKGAKAPSPAYVSDFLATPTD